MPYPVTLTRLSFGGTMCGGNEIWSCSVHLGSGVGTPTTEEEWFDFYLPKSSAIKDAVEAFIENTGSRVPADVVMNQVKLAHIGTDGKYLHEPIDMEASASGTTNTPYLPQGSLVNSLVSDKWKDPGKYNRFYLPTLAPNTSDLWRLSVAEQTAATAALQGFLQDINDVLAADTPAFTQYVVVASNTGTGSLMPATKVRIGRIIDTQRRRRNDLVEQYYELPVF